MEIQMDFHIRTLENINHTLEKLKTKTSCSYISQEKGINLVMNIFKTDGCYKIMYL